jgi:putative N6-adenine-specific DNA methylase
MKIHKTEKSGNAFEKRIKRRINARKHSFFAVTTPGLEEICRNEIVAVSSYTETEIEIESVENGGVSFTASPAGVYAINLYSRTATRILMRIEEFHADSFAEFETEFHKIPWELYIKKGCIPEVQVSCSKCRLYHSDAIAERVSKWFSVINKKADPKRKKQEIFIKGYRDRFLISINTSGDPLYKRGLKEGGGMAPLRETLASGILSLAGYRPGMILLDPMCGTGTFSLEAAMISKNIPAGFFRDFAFTDWPSFMEKRWQYMLAMAGKGIKKETESPSSDNISNRIINKFIYASDIDSIAVERLKLNIEKSGLCDIVSVKQMDFFEISGKDLPGKGLVVINPPYGKRLGDRYHGTRFFNDVCLKLSEDFKGWKVAIIAPGDFFSARMPYNKIRLHDAFHGGLKLKVLTANI